MSTCAIAPLKRRVVAPPVLHKLPSCSPPGPAPTMQYFRASGRLVSAIICKSGSGSDSDPGSDPGAGSGSGSGSGCSHHHHHHRQGTGSPRVLQP